MKKPLLVTIALIFLLQGCAAVRNLGRREALEAQPAPEAAAKLGLDDLLFPANGSPGDKELLLRSLHNSLRYLSSPKAEKDYKQISISGVSRAGAICSLKRFEELAEESKTADELWRHVQEEFTLYRAKGKNGNGDVQFTAYFQPAYSASRTRTAEYRYPLYRQPFNFTRWKSAKRAELEGKNGLDAGKGPLWGRELVYLKDRFEAFLVHVQGSAVLYLTDGTVMRVGFADATIHPHTSVGAELVRDGKMRPGEVTVPAIAKYFHDHPAEMDNYLPRNDRFVFFKEVEAHDATGSLGLPVTANRSVATDKSMMPPGALALFQTRLPVRDADGVVRQRRVSRYVFDQDTGNAIQGPGRVDIFTGSGAEAGERAGVTNSVGELYYLFLKEDGPRGAASCVNRKP